MEQKLLVGYARVDLTPEQYPHWGGNGLDGKRLCEKVSERIYGTCIAMTCMELTDTCQVVLLCGDKSITIGQDNLLLYHQTAEQTQEETK